MGMPRIAVYIESGKKKTFAGAVDWPGWCRRGKNAQGAMQALIDYAPRYAKVLEGSSLSFEVPAGLEVLQTVEEHPGTSTTDFGAPDAILEEDHAPLDQAAFARADDVLQACWDAFATAFESSEGKELRKGPRGGGRDQQKITHHLLESHTAYLRKIGWKYKVDKAAPLNGELARISDTTREALTAALHGELPETGPRGGQLWPVRYFVRRAAWHILDHAWEIEDRLV
jgi:hypothetical protein